MVQGLKRQSHHWYGSTVIFQDFCLKHNSFTNSESGLSINVWRVCSLRTMVASLALCKILIYGSISILSSEGLRSVMVKTLCSQTAGPGSNPGQRTFFSFHFFAFHFCFLFLLFISIFAFYIYFLFLLFIFTFYFHKRNVLFCLIPFHTPQSYRKALALVMPWLKHQGLGVSN